MAKRVFKEKTDDNRGASALTYGLLVGLIGVIALGTIDGMGRDVNSLFGQVSDNMASAGGFATGDGSPVVTAVSFSYVDTNGDGTLDNGSSGANYSFGTVPASGDKGIAAFAIIAGDPGGATPYYSISNDGTLSTTADAPSGLRSGTDSLTIQATDSDGNTGQAVVTISITKPFVCGSGSSPQSSVTGQLDNGTAVTFHACGANRITNAYNAFSDPNINVVTTCLARSNFDAPFQFSGGDSEFYRYEMSFTDSVSARSNTSDFRNRTCTNASCSSASGPTVRGGSTSQDVIDSVTLCTISLYDRDMTGEVAWSEFGFNTSGQYRRWIERLGTGDANGRVDTYSDLALYRSMQRLGSGANGAANFYRYLEYQIGP
ncbi:MAG: hypothetical protein Alpg2KO_27100 [Alphaproteobacteria bacterium]